MHFPTFLHLKAWLSFEWILLLLKGLSHSVCVQFVDRCSEVRLDVVGRKSN